MSTREETLRRIFEATGVSGRLTEDQKRELLAHLEDAVASKVAAGTAEMEAVGQAFAEMGPLPKIADQLAPRHPWLVSWSRYAALKGVALLLLFSFIQTFLTPKFMAFFEDLAIPIPSLTLVFMTGFDQDFVLALGALLLGLGLAQGMAWRKGWTQKTVTGLRISALALYGVVALICSGLAVGCVMGIATVFRVLIP